MLACSVSSDVGMDLIIADSVYDLVQALPPCLDNRDFLDLCVGLLVAIELE